MKKWLGHPEPGFVLVSDPFSWWEKGDEELDGCASRQLPVAFFSHCFPNYSLPSALRSLFFVLPS